LKTNEISQVLLETCSERFKKECKLLEEQLRYDEERVNKRLAELTTKPKLTAREEIEIADNKARLRVHYLADQAPGFYVLNKIGSNLVKDYLAAANDSNFWKESFDDLYDNPHLLWFLNELGVQNEHFSNAIDDFIIKNQTVEGFVHSNNIPHTSALRVLVAALPNSSTLASALNYWAKNWESSWDCSVVALGILALDELDCEKYADEIQKQIDFLRSKQNTDGSWNKFGDRTATCYSIWAITRCRGIDDSTAQKGFDWIMRIENGSLRGLPDLLISMLAMGDGPKISVDAHENSVMKMEQRIRKQTPQFLHTSPLFPDSVPVRQIHDKVHKMLHEARSEIRISSPFIDILYEDIINIGKENPDLVIKVITRPKREPTGLRDRIARNVIDLLNTATRGCVFQTELVHARLVIIDKNQVLISSADLTRDQLYDEFNAGLWTSDKAVVEKATEFFDNIYNLRNSGAN
jgi:hypothetical protein